MQTEPPTPLQRCDLGDVSPETLAQLRACHLSERQAFHGGSFAESLEAWCAGPRETVLGVGFIHVGAPIGRALFKRPPLSPDWAPTDVATIHGLKIATPWQGRGWGHRGLALALAHLAEHWPEVARVMLAVDTDNDAAIAIYRNAGFRDLGSSFQGNHGPEYRMERAVHATA